MKRATLSWLGVATFLLGVSPGVGQEQSAKPALLATSTGHTNRIYCGVFTPDSRTFLSAGIDKEIRAWNVADGKPIYSLKGHGAPVRALGLAAGKLLISASADGSIYLWDLAGRKKVGELAKQKHNVDSLAVSPDGKTLATSTGAWNKSLPGDLRLWDLRSRKEIGALPHPQPVLAAAFSPDNRLLAAVDHTGAIKVWDVKTRKPVVTLFQDPACGSVEFSPDGKLLATGDFTGRVTLWDTGTWCEE